MNTPRFATHRFSAFALALVMTLSMLGAVDHLATSDAGAPQMARTDATATRG